MVHVHRIIEAIESGEVRIFADRKQFNDPIQNGKQWQEELTAQKQLVADLMDSAKFSLGDIEDLPIWHAEHLSKEILSLPALIVYVEGEIHSDSGQGAKLAGLCHKPEFIPDHIRFVEHAEVAGKHEVLFSVIPMAELEGSWSVFGCTYLVSLCPDKVLVNRGVFDVFEKLQKKHEEFVQETSELIVSAAIGLLNVLSCSNVNYVVNPAPAKLNKKREKKGRVPLFDYRTVHIETRKQIYLRSDGTQGLHRNSPRLHFRRGHIRTLHKHGGRRIWVNQCMVGDEAKGRVEKEYVLDRTGSADGN